MQDRKEAFLARARAGSTENYLNSTRTKPAGPYEIKAGWDIPAVLEQALNSDLPGEIKALVRENVYDTATGQVPADSARCPPGRHVRLSGWVRPGWYSGGLEPPHLPGWIIDQP